MLMRCNDEVLTVNTCPQCGTTGGYDCEECCPGTTKTTKSGYTYCLAGKGPSPSPSPSPPSPPSPPGKCGAELVASCGAAQKEGVTQCDACLKTDWTKITAAGCSIDVATSFCKGGGPPKPADKCETTLTELCGKAEEQVRKQDAVSAQKLGQLQPFTAVCIPTRIHGPTCILWAKLTPSSLPGRARVRDLPRRAPRGHRRRGLREAGGDEVLRGESDDDVLVLPYSLRTTY
jgi:hypothetical protein